MRKPIKTIARFLTALCAAAIPFSLAATAQAGGDGQVCGLQTLHGSYVFTAQGFNIVDGVAQPKAIIEGIDFNGDGTLSVPFATLSINGLILHIPPGGTGTYTLDDTCQGTLTFAAGPVNYGISVQRPGREISMIQTDPNTVFQGTVKKIGR